MLIIRCKKNKGLFLSIAVTVRTILLISFFSACACSEDVSLCQCTQLEEDFIELRKEFEDFIKTLNLSKRMSRKNLYPLSRLMICSRLGRK